MPSQRYRVVAVNQVTRRVVGGVGPIPREIHTLEVRAAAIPPPDLAGPSGWSANTPDLSIQFTIWGASLARYVPGFEFDLVLP